MNPGFGWGEWELVKILRRRTPKPFEVWKRSQTSNQPESLILAQSERWRQA
jgi:hypothetical protein